MVRIIDLYNRYKEIVNYLIFGVLTTFVSLIVYYFLAFTILDPNNAIELQMANIISWIVSVTFAYVANRKYVFDSKSKNILKEISSFVGSRAITLIMDMIIMFVGVTILMANDKVIKLFSQIVVIVSNYLFSKLFVFKK